MRQLKILVIGGTGSAGRLVVSEALAKGHKVRALVRNAARASRLPAVETAVGDVTKPETLAAALEGIDAVVLNADGQGRQAAESVYYRGVGDLIAAIGGRPVRIALMTTIGVTERRGSYNLTNEGHDWKRRNRRSILYQVLEAAA